MQKPSLSRVRVLYPELDEEEIIQEISSWLESVEERPPLLLVALFGSYGRGNSMVRDGDLLVTYGNEEKEEAYAIVKRALDMLCLEPHAQPERKCGRVAAVVAEMVKHAVVILADACQARTKWERQV